MKQVNSRTTSEILSFLGDIGGFWGFLSIFGILSNLISQKAKTANLGNLGNRLYKQKVKANKQNTKIIKFSISDLFRS